MEIPKEELPEGEEEEEERDWLYRVSSVNDEVKVTPLEDEILSKGILDPLAVFVLDCETEIFVWFGKYSQFPERRAAVMLAEEFVQMFERPVWTSIVKVRESAEPAYFKDKFVDWFDAPVMKAAQTSRIAETREQIPIDVDLLHRKKPQIESIPVFEEESDCLEVWSIDNNSKANPLEEQNIGIFYNSKSYIALFSYIETGILKSTAFFWEGSKAKTGTYLSYKFGFYELLEKKMKDEGGNPPLQMRLFEGHEPASFLQILNTRNPVLILKVDYSIC